MKKAILYTVLSILLLSIHPFVLADQFVPESLQDVCSAVVLASKPITAGSACAYPNALPAIQKRTVCVTYGPDINLGTYSSVCCETQAQCSKLSTAVDTNLCHDSQDCKKCLAQDKKVWTAIGCIEVTSSGLLSKFLPFAIGIAGGIAFLLMLFGALQMMMSAGNPEKLNAGKELVTAAITGLLFIIFSIFILRLVGVNILQIPGFS